MIFDDFNPKEDKMFGIIDNEGVIINAEFMPDMSDDDVVKAYKDMLFARTADNMAVSYQRQGRMYTYLPTLGRKPFLLPQEWL